jgi:hypothetical protein
LDQIVQVLGSLLILAAFVTAQRGWLSSQSRLYLSLNFVGAGVLAAVAADAGQLGFLVLESSWAVVAGHSLVRALHRRAMTVVKASPSSTRSSSG